MKMNISDPPKTRLFSPNGKFWVDIVELGEIAMGAERREYITSFVVDGVNSFTFVNAKCHFIDDSRFLLMTPEIVILNYMVEQQTMHLTREDIPSGCSWIDVDFTNLIDPTLIFRKENLSEDRVPLSKSLGLFQPGSSSLSKYLTPPK